MTHYIITHQSTINFSTLKLSRSLQENVLVNTCFFASKKTGLKVQNSSNSSDEECLQSMYEARRLCPIPYLGFMDL